jgi:hypothetical protein
MCLPSAIKLSKISLIAEIKPCCFATNKIPIVPIIFKFLDKATRLALSHLLTIDQMLILQLESSQHIHLHLDLLLF